MNNPDDGGLPYHPVGSGDIRDPTGVTIRAKFAAQFAAAWLPIVAARGKDIADFHLSDAANAKGLAMADDLIRRMREST